MEIEKLSLNELFSRCKISQLWAVIVVIAGLITGAFGLGYKIHASINEAKINSIQLEITKLNGDIQSKKKKLSKTASENKFLHDKDLFLSLYLRYQLTKEKWNNDYDAKEDYQEYMTTRKVFDKYIIERVGREKLRISKGGGRLATIKFDDGAVWTVPRELHAAAEE
jgi:hypothetical protein